MENLIQDFIHFGAVVKIRRFYKDDLYKFVKLMILLGIFNNDITYFINAMEIIGKGNKIANNLSINGKIELLDEEFTDSGFWHLIDINEGRLNEVAIEYQYGKGFTFGKVKDYTDYDETIKVISVDELIKDCNREVDFNMGYVETSFLQELDKKDEEIAIMLTDFCEWYEWQLVKYSNGLYNILDLQTEELVGNMESDNNGNGTLQMAMQRVYDRLVGYSIDEQEYETYEELKKDFEDFKILGKKYNLADETDIKWYDDFIKESKEDFKII